MLNPSRLVYLTLSATLCACGGGGGDNSSNATPSASTSAPSPNTGTGTGTGGTGGTGTGGTGTSGTGTGTGGTGTGGTDTGTGGTDTGTGGTGTGTGTTPTPTPAAMSWRGVSLAGAEFGSGNLPGTYNSDYTYPTVASVAYFKGKGMNLVRLPFLWERLQPALNQSFDATELARLTDFVDQVSAGGTTVLLDPHNYARYRGNLIGSSAVPNAAFADFWSRLATRFKGNNKVVFGLMNEPHDMPTEQWLGGANAALAAIRNAGAGNVVFVPGNAWTGAHSWEQNWYGTPNATVMKGIVDPSHNMVFEVHQYLDGDSSGTSEACVSATIGAERLQAFTTWLRSNGYRGFLGEFAGGANATCDQAVANTLAYLDTNADVWTGWSWWAAGPWWGNYMYSLEPNGSADKPQMNTLAPYLASSPAPVPTTTTTTPPPAVVYDTTLITSGNPFAGALFYVSPDYVASVDSSLAKVSAGSADAALVNKAKAFPTAVWLDRLAAIDGAKAQGGEMGLVNHLNAALTQQKSQSSGTLKPMTVQLIVYDLPDRDCAALASNGELSSANNGMQTYKTNYIDRIAEILARPAYAGLRIVTLIEPDSFPNMLTNVNNGKPVCDAVDRNKVYVEGIQYTLNKLSTMKNVYMYLDIAHAGWLGWDNNRAKAIAGYKTLVAGATANGDLSIIRGFASNTANYTPLDEPFFDGTDNIASTHFYEWNRAVDELTYIDKLRTEFVANGFPSSLGFIVDTGRNGWGGPARPKAAAANVDDMRIDRRNHRGNWCNVRNTGIGERPRANPDATRSYLDAYVFSKPPGASDGTSDASATTPNAEGKRFDPMCGSGNIDALTGAPHAGIWFHEQFLMLLRNAYPALQ